MFCPGESFRAITIVHYGYERKVDLSNQMRSIAENAPVLRNCAKFENKNKGARGSAIINPRGEELPVYPNLKMYSKSLIEPRNTRSAQKRAFLTIYFIKL